jgi:hypothetical protein
MSVLLDTDLVRDARAGRVDLLDVPPRFVLTVPGFGSPQGTAFHNAAATLMPLAWAVHAALKREYEITDHRVAHLEALWWLEGEDATFSPEEKALWCWEMLIAESDDVPVSLLQRLIRDLPPAKNLPSGRLVTVRRFDEGLSVQTLHVGPYATESATIALLGEFMAAHDLVPNGRHHEIYLSDPRRCDPERLHTVLRQPVRID